MPIIPDDPQPGGGPGSSGGGGTVYGGFAPGASAPLASTMLGLPVRRPGSMGGFGSFGTIDLPPVEEPGQKGNRVYDSPPGGGGGGGIGFGGFGVKGGSINPYGMGGASMAGENIPIMVRKRQIPGLTPGPPGRTDTVPAMLTPGEMVMNRGVTGNPQLAQILAMLNMQGAQRQVGGPGQTGAPISQAPMGFEHGGVVPDGERYCPHCGRMHDAEGYALGGFVRQPGYGGFLGRNQAAPMDRRPGGPPAPAPAPGGGTFGGYTRNPEGGVTNFNPADPWGTYTKNYDPRVYGQGVRQLGGFGEAGYFDPRGNQMLLNSMQEGAQGTADALVRRQMAQADLSGLDPAQAAAMKMQALRETGRGVQDIMAQTRAGALQNQNQFAQDLYRQLLAGDLGFTGQTNEARLQDWQAGKQQGRQGGGFGGLIGSVAGTALGSFGGALGSRLGGGKRSVPIPQTAYDWHNTDVKPRP